MIAAWIPGHPKGQPRPRAFVRGGKARVYDPGTAEGWKGKIALELGDMIPDKPLDTPLWIRLVFYMPRPQSHYRTGKFAGELKPSAAKYYTGKPDIDNLAKAVLDALTDLRIIADDKLIVDVSMSKFYENSKGPGVSLYLAELPRLGEKTDAMPSPYSD